MYKSHPPPPLQSRVVYLCPTHLHLVVGNGRRAVTACSRSREQLSPTPSFA